MTLYFGYCSKLWNANTLPKTITYTYRAVYQYIIEDINVLYNKFGFIDIVQKHINLNG